MRQQSFSFFLTASTAICATGTFAEAQVITYTTRTGQAYCAAGFFPPTSANPTWSGNFETHYHAPIDLGYASANFELDAEPSPTSLHLHVFGGAARSTITPSVPQAYMNGSDNWTFTISQPVCFSLQITAVCGTNVTTQPLPSTFGQLVSAIPGGILLSTGGYTSNISLTAQGTQGGTITRSGTLSPGTYTLNASQTSNCNGVHSTGTNSEVWFAIGAPVLSVQAQDASACAGNDATLSVAATGGGTTGYQWQCSITPTSSVYQNVTNGTLPAVTGSASTASGATSPTLAIHSADSAAARRYRCVVSNSCGTLNSNAATLTVAVCGTSCDSIDFNNDGLFPDSLDIDDFLSVFSGGPCSNDPNCRDIDFNNDGLFPDSLDIDSLLSVFSGGACL